MANGDAAAAAGMDVVPGTADRRLGYDEINKTRDYVADHKTSGTHPASAINSGVLDIARIPAIDAARLPASIPGTKISGPVGLSGGTSAFDAISVGGLGFLIDSAGRIYSPTTYGTVLGGSYNALYVNSAGQFGHVPSSERFKTDIFPPDLARARAVLAIRVVTFRYREEFGGDGAEVWGVIAEELHALGLTEFVGYDEDGAPFTVHHDRLIFPMLAIIQDHEARLNALENEER